MNLASTRDGIIVTARSLHARNNLNPCRLKLRALITKHLLNCSLKSMWYIFSYISRFAISLLFSALPKGEVNGSLKKHYYLT